eukprot:g32452.t1
MTCRPDGFASPHQPVVQDSPPALASGPRLTYHTGLLSGTHLSCQPLVQETPPHSPPSKSRKTKWEKEQMEQKVRVPRAADKGSARFGTGEILLCNRETKPRMGDHFEEHFCFV